MSIGLGIFMDEYKDLSIEELNNKLREFKKDLKSIRLKLERIMEIISGIDDTNCIANKKSQITAIENLIKEKEILLNEENEIEDIIVEYSNNGITAKFVELLNVFISNNLKKKLFIRPSLTDLEKKDLLTMLFLLNMIGEQKITTQLLIDQANKIILKYDNVETKDIIAEYSNNGITSKLVELLEDFTHKIIKDNIQNPFLKEDAKKILVMLFLSNLISEKEVTIQLLIDQTNPIDVATNIIKNNIAKFNIPESKSIMLNAERLFSGNSFGSLIEKIHNDILNYDMANKAFEKIKELLHNIEFSNGILETSYKCESKQSPEITNIILEELKNLNIALENWYD